ncbi:MAG: response regulator transcription factor [Candidatus Acidiferrales bacterium]
MNHGSILVSDNDPQIRRLLQTILAGEGFEISSARDCEAAIDLIRSSRFDLLLLGLDAPDRTTIRTCREIRALSDIGIILLARSTAEGHKVDTLLAGADDYLTKPFSMPELLARIRVVLRRRAVLSSLECSPMHLEDLQIDFDKRRVRVHDREERLTPKEFDVLRYLAARANKVVGHRELMQAVWGIDYDSREQCLRGCIVRLRKKIEASANQPKYLVTVPWVGYELRLPE